MTSHITPVKELELQVETIREELASYVAHLEWILVTVVDMTEERRTEELSLAGGFDTDLLDDIYALERITNYLGDSSVTVDLALGHAKKIRAFLESHATIPQDNESD